MRLQLLIIWSQDVHTSRWIVEKCFKSELIRGRTVILVVCEQLVATKDLR